ncbi:30S ribosomal protein S6 [Candidatus Saccharibacteria bacterium]|nr:30S ribosomal protein S6 [Candidatus Saccharibacteria bacterium]
MDSYELAVLFHPDLEIDLEKAGAQIEKLVSAAGGRITATDNWGKRKLAYKIAGHEHAVYVFYTLELPGQGVRTLNDALNITGEVIRFLITKPDVKAIAKAEAMKVSRDKRIAAHGDKDTDEDESEDEE